LNVLHRETEVHRLLTRERVLGLNLVMGVKVGPPGEGRVHSGEALDGDLQASDLPLFVAEDTEGD
jgi:hypothetical protein